MIIIQMEIIWEMNVFDSVLLGDAGQIAQYSKEENVKSRKKTKSNLK